jgi:hypothetical protein
VADRTEVRLKELTEVELVPHQSSPQASHPVDECLSCAGREGRISRRDQDDGRPTPAPPGGPDDQHLERKIGVAEISPGVATLE